MSRVIDHKVKSKAHRYHLRYGGYNEFVIKSFKGDKAALEAAKHWLVDQAEAEKRFDQAFANECHRMAKEEILRDSMPCELEFRNALGVPFVLRLWEETPDDKLRVHKQTLGDG